jgi:hypothetical protein
MSASDVVIAVPTVSTVSKKPKLAAKYEKVLVVAYSLIQAFSANGILPQDNLAAAYDEILLFAPVEDQTLFYELFLDNAKDNAKAMRKVITLHNKPPKAPKEPKATKPKATKEPKTGDDYLASSNAPVEEKKKRVYKKKTADAPVEPAPVETKPKKSRAKKNVSVSNDVQDDLIGQIISAANSTPVQDEEEQEEEVIHTREFTLNGKLFLIDDDNQLYDANTFELFGTFDPATLSIM